MLCGNTSWVSTLRPFGAKADWPKRVVNGRRGWEPANQLSDLTIVGEISRMWQMVRR